MIITTITTLPPPPSSTSTIMMMMMTITIILSFQTQGLGISSLLSWAEVMSWCQFRGTPLALVWLCPQGWRSLLLIHSVYK